MVFWCRYEVCRLLGSGNFSDVYLVKNRFPTASPAKPFSAHELLFAVKKTKTALRSLRDRDSQLQEIKVYEHLSRCAQAMREAGNTRFIAAGIQRIVKYYAAWQEEGYLHIKMGACNAGNLLQFISRVYGRDRHIPMQSLWEWTAQCAEGLRFLHACRYVHLDIKPDNLFIEDDGNSHSLKIGDLGLARQQGPADYENNGDSRYLAPELLALKTEHIAASDIFSLGMSLLQLAATMTLPKEGDEWMRLRQGQWLPLSRLQANHVPAPMIELMRAMLARNPKLRPTSADVLHFCAPFRAQRPVPESPRSETDLARVDERALVVASKEVQKQPSLLATAARASASALTFHRRGVGSALDVRHSLYVLRLVDQCARRSGGSMKSIVSDLECDDYIEGVRSPRVIGKRNEDGDNSDFISNGHIYLNSDGVHGGGGGGAVCRSSMFDGDSDDDDDESSECPTSDFESPDKPVSRSTVNQSGRPFGRLRLPSFHDVSTADTPTGDQARNAIGGGVSRQLMLSPCPDASPQSQSSISDDDDDDDDDDEEEDAQGQGSLNGVKKLLF